jgi:diguanylate cyclase (GGDEF)-like protein/PAS domain S-box-containing protein
LNDGPSGPNESTARVFSTTELDVGAIFDRSAVAMCIVDDDGRVARVNDSLSSLLGRTRSELVGSTWTDLTHADDVAKERAMFATVLDRTTSSFVLEKRFRGESASPLWCRQTVTVLDDQDHRSPTLLVELVDTTAQHVLAAKLRTSEERTELTIAAAQDAFVGMSSDGTITGWNKVAESMFGWPADEVIGRKLSTTIVPEDQRAAHERGLARYLETGEARVLERRIEVTAVRRDGVEIRVELTIWPVAGNDGVEFNAFLRDVSERLRFQEELRQLAIAATTDQGTGLKNRRGFFALAEHELSVAQRLGHSLTLIFFDLDRLKAINDTFGHLEGDRAIADTARILKSTFRESDLVARLGGDEFCVLALGPREGFTKTMQRFDEALAEHNRKSNRAYSLSLSYGVAFFDPNEDKHSLDELMSAADVSMYQFKLGRRPA